MGSSLPWLKRQINSDSSETFWFEPLRPDESSVNELDAPTMASESALDSYPLTQNVRLTRFHCISGGSHQILSNLTGPRQVNSVL
jgi:hypothetical protein